LKIENVKEREVKFDGYEGRIGWNVHWQEGSKWMRGDIHISVLREAQKSTPLVLRKKEYAESVAG